MKTLRQAVGKLTEQELERLAQRWGVWTQPSTGSSWLLQPTLLVQAMQQPIAVRFAWEPLSENERKVLHHALSVASSDGVLQNVLRSMTRLDEEAFAAAAGALQHALLLAEEKVSVKTGKVLAGTSLVNKTPAEISVRLGVLKDMAPALLVIDREIFTAKQDRSSWKLEQLMASVNIDKIYAIGQHYSLPLQNYYYGRTDVRAKLVEQLLEPDVHYFAWDQFDANTRKLCKWLVDANGKATMTAAREFTGFDNPTMARCLATLDDYAIVFDTFVGPERVLFVPSELLTNLKKVITGQATDDFTESFNLHPLETAPVAIHQGGPLALYDLATIIGSTYQQNMEPTQGGYIPKRLVNKLVPLLRIKPRVQASYSAQEILTVDMLFDIASQLGLLKLSRSSNDAAKPRYEESTALRRWVQKSEQEMVRSLLDLWLQNRQWIDIVAPNYDEQSNFNQYYFMDYQSGRKGLVEYLRTCVPGQWYSLTSLLRTIKHEKPFILRTSTFQSGVTGMRNAKALLAKWMVADGAILTGYLTSTLYEMGIVALGYSQHETLQDGKAPALPSAFMITDLGNSVLAAEKEKGKKTQEAKEVSDAAGKQDGQVGLEERPGQPRALIVQPNFELMLLQTDMPTLYRLLPFAQVIQIDRVSRLTLTKNSMLRGLEFGRNVELILSTLRECSQKELPQNVVYSINDWARGYKEVTVSQVFLLEVPSEAMGDELAAADKLKDYGLRRLSPTVFITGNETNIQELRKALEKLGTVARIHGDIIPREKNTVATSYSSYGRYR